MPFYEKGDVRIHYEEAGSGFPANASAAIAGRTKFARDSPLEGTGFESVPRDTTKVSGPAHVASA
jgi:hypothetical protein